MVNPVIRIAQREDLPAIIEIYNSTIPSRIVTADLEPISWQSRLNWFEEHDSNTRPLLVLELEKRAIGWLSLQSFYGRPAYQATAEVSIYIANSYSRKGWGSYLLKHSLEMCPKWQVNTLLGFIFAHNYPSLNLFQKFQFQQWGYFPKVAKLDGLERDLIIMGLRVN
ncbi:N-acetyltransferase [Merismopedia glauca CCAP 1448/3]|uniref:N-acetyltransferase n=1 Tax=Merismopedia glauca CCAP 1448/3 TaxID=1296344 RepID=A0A2T1C4T5_9CYAN|nr:N-acetyltransferase [Merismopedia glauca CCAP 1448/3]